MPCPEVTVSGCVECAIPVASALASVVLVCVCEEAGLSDGFTTHSPESDFDDYTFFNTTHSGTLYILYIRRGVLSLAVASTILYVETTDEISRY